VDFYIHDYAGHVGQIEVARGLAARGHRVVFTYCDELSTPRGGLTPDAELEALAIEPIGIGRPINKKNYFKRQGQDVLYARALVRNLRQHRPELVVSANTPLIPQWALVRYCRRHRIPVVHWWTDIYSLAVRHGVGQKFGPLGRIIVWSYQKLETSLLQRSQAVIGIAEQFRTIAKQWGVKTPVAVIPVPAPTERVRPGNKRNPWSIKHGVADTANIVYCGTLGNKHHPELLFSLAEKLRSRGDVRLIVAAGGVGADWLAAEQQKANLRNLILLPFQPFEDYPNILAAADVHVTVLNRDASAYALPSKVMSQLCAARAQVAMVPRDNQGATLIVEGNAGFVYTPDEFDGAFASIKQLLGDANLRQQYGENGRRYADAKLSLTALLPQYEKLFQDVITTAAK
jgi:glycosyltransferase involved in cell wall biosynthesis